jgi:hypothetical protein
MKSHVVAAAVILGLLVAPIAEAKVVPRLNRQVAAPGTPVVLSLGTGIDRYLTGYYLAPFEISLVPVRTARAVAGREELLRRRDPRLRPVGQLGSVGKPIPSARMRFLVPWLAPGRYALVVFTRRTDDRRWANVTAGWWGLPRFWRDPALQRGIVLRITPPG